MLKQLIVSDEAVRPASRNEDKWQLMAMVQQSRIRNGCQLSVAFTQPQPDKISSRIKSRMRQMLKSHEDSERGIRLIEAQFYRVI